MICSWRSKMTSERLDSVSLEDAKKQVEIVARRMAILHLSYAKTLVEEFGEDLGRKLILKAIKGYGVRIGRKIKKDEPDLSKYGVHERIEWVNVDGEKRVKIYGCALAKEWKEWGENSLGRLYCLVDPAKSMTIDPTEKVTHTKAIPDGDEYCELAFRPTTAKERNDFEDREADWAYIDQTDTLNQDAREASK